MRRDFELERELEWDRMCAAAQANMARYVYDAAGQCRGRCVGHDRGGHHPLCPAATDAEKPSDP